MPNERALKSSNPLRGVVTPFMQETKTCVRDNISLYDIFNDNDLLSKFQSNTFPKMDKTSTGELFFIPVARVISPVTGVYYTKWFSLNRNKEFSHDHSYDYARIHKDGYLMKLDVVKDDTKIIDYSIVYLTPVDNVEIITESKNDFSVIDPNDRTVIAYDVKSFDIYKHQDIIEKLSDKDKFIFNYLNDMIE